MLLKIHLKAFAELSTDELYKLMTLRQAVFVVEQDCPYLDADNKDQEAHHIMGYDEAAELVAYARILPPGLSYPEYSSIGRVVSNSKARGTGVGKQLMTFAIAQTKELYPSHNIKISAQVYIMPFYKNLGFVEQGEEYMEDNIPHKAMVLSF